MVILQQYVFGLLFFGFLGFSLGAIRKFREVKKVTRTTRLTGSEWRTLLGSGVTTLWTITLWWTVLYGVVLGMAYIGSM